MERDKIIEVRDLVKRFGSFTAVKGISFTVSKGEIFGFLGANGAGKTTAMKMLCGLLKPTSGYGRVAGYNIATEPEKVKRNIGYMSQRFSLYNDLKVWENFRLFGGIYGMKSREIREATDRMLATLGLEKERETIVKSLPSGWKQRLAFSVAIMHNPALLFLDEPTGGVAPEARRQFWELIYWASQMGVTVFVTTHYMDEAEYCDRVSIMREGELVAIDSPSKLKREKGVSTMEELFYKLSK